MNQPPTDHEMELLYLLYLARDFIEDTYAGHGLDVKRKIDAALMAVGSEEWWEQYNLERYRQGKR